MKFVVLRQRAAQVCSIDISGRWVLGVGAAVLLTVISLSFLAGFSFAARADGESSLLAHFSASEQRDIDDLRARLQERIDAMSARVGQLNAHVIRLDALGKRLAEMAAVDSRELRKRTLPEGRPVERGFLSSGFGNRQDPLSGDFSFHRGVDFAGNAGDLVIAVGAGVVTFAGYRPDYGFMVDVTHGDGYVTRYAHNARVLVRQGETVARGQRLAVMGSTGRSTGPHVHFEVLRNGTPVNPLAYLGG